MQPWPQGDGHRTRWPSPGPPIPLWDPLPRQGRPRAPGPALPQLEDQGLSLGAEGLLRTPPHSKPEDAQPREETGPCRSARGSVRCWLRVGVLIRLCVG